MTDLAENFPTTNKTCNSRVSNTDPSDGKALVITVEPSVI
jgi:hypothetical protein